MSDALIIGGLSINTIVLLGIVFKAGRYAERIEAAEKRLQVIEEAKMEISLTKVSSDVQHLTGLVGAMGDRLEAIVNLLTKSNTKFSAQSGD